MFTVWLTGYKHHQQTNVLVDKRSGLNFKPNFGFVPICIIL